MPALLERRIWFFIMSHVEGHKAPLILKMYENECRWAQNMFGYNINLWTDCFNEIIFLDKWACTKKLAQPKTFFSSKSWRSFSKERLHTTVTCHCAILRNIEILVYYRGTSFVEKNGESRLNHKTAHWDQTLVPWPR